MNTSLSSQGDSAPHIVDRLRRRLFGPRRYEIVAEQGITDPEQVFEAAREWSRRGKGPADSWPYLLKLLDEEALGWDALMSRPTIVPIEVLIRYQGGRAFRDNFRAVIAQYRQSKSEVYVLARLQRAPIEPELWFSILDLMEEIPYAHYCTSSGVKVVVSKNRYFSNPGTLAFYHPKGIASVAIETLTAFEIYEGHIYLNGIKSKFECVMTDADREAIEPFVAFMAETISSNYRKAVRAQSRLAQSNSQDATSAVNPWVAGAVGAGLGALAGVALADE